jgi:hypothetical protein
MTREELQRTWEKVSDRPDYVHWLEDRLIEVAGISDGLKKTSFGKTTMPASLVTLAAIALDKVLLLGGNKLERT